MIASTTSYVTPLSPDIHTSDTPDLCANTHRGCL